MNATGHNPAYRALSTRGLDRQALLEAPAVLANGEFVAARCIELGADPARVVTLHEPIDRDVFSPEGKVEGPEGRPQLLARAGSGCALALDACARVARKHPGLKLVVIGEPAEDLAGFKFAEAVPDSEHDLANRLRWADALLVAEVDDGTTGLMARALSCGTPCIAPKHGAVTELATDRWDSLLFAPGDSKELAKAVAAIAEPATQARLAAPARAAGEPFDAQAVAKRESGVRAFLAREEFPLVSIVLPTYNRAHLIADAVANVLEQDYPNFELIVVNDGSRDGTREVLDGLNDPRLTVIHRENGSLPRALNTGFKHARGEYWTWTSDDNAYRQGAIRAMVRELELDTDAGLVYAEMTITTHRGQKRHFVGGPPEGITEGCCVGACFLYRAEVARRVGEYDPELFLAEDYDYWLRMRHHTRFIWLQRVLYDYTDGEDTLTRRRTVEAHRVAMKLVERELGASPEWPRLKFERLCWNSGATKNYGLTWAAIRNALAAIRVFPRRSRGWWVLLRALTPRALLVLTRRIRGLDVD